MTAVARAIAWAVATAAVAGGAVANPVWGRAAWRTDSPASAPPAHRTQGTATRPIVVASKPFGESFVLAEMFARLLEARGFAVDRRPGLGATEIAFGAIRTGAIDVYPEYTGTGLLAILHDTTRHDARTAYADVARTFTERWSAHWLPPLGFENSYAISVRRETAARYHLRTLSDLAGAAPQLAAGLTADFIGRADGLPGIERAYGIQFRVVRPLLPAVKYQALAAARVDVIDGYQTDGLIARYDLVVLDDDRGFFPPYEAAALVGARLWSEAPAAVRALTELSGRLDVATMRALNRRVEVDGAPVAEVAAGALRDLGLVGTKEQAVAGAPPGQQHAAVAAGSGNRSIAGRTDSSRGGGERAPSLADYLWSERSAIVSRSGRHLFLVAVSLLAALLVALPLGLVLERTRGVAEGVVRAVGVLQTIPGIALLAFMLPLLGIGVLPALVALFAYSLYPILRNTYSGVRDADPAAVAAAHALGMTPAQVLRHVRLPLAAPAIMAGVRTAAVIDVGAATLAAFIGAGGLGEPIVSGLALSDTRMILSGAIPAALLALAVDLSLALVERGVRPQGVE